MMSDVMTGDPSNSKLQHASMWYLWYRVSLTAKQNIIFAHHDLLHGHAGANGLHDPAAGPEHLHALSHDLLFWVFHYFA